MTEQNISLERLEETINVFGSFDENIRMIEHEMGVTVVSRDSMLKVSGENPEGVMYAVRAIESLMTLWSTSGIQVGGLLFSGLLISALTENDSRGVVMESFPWSKRLGWTIKEFGPLPVPAKGQVVSLDSISILFYQHIIRYEQKKELSLRDKLIYLGDSLIREYRFKENYYFVSGDNMENSRDSRYWGLLPESYIVGKATRIWKSKDPADGHIRWDRVFKKIE